MHLVREDELLDVHAAWAEARYEVYGLRKDDVAVVVAMDEEDGGFPGVHVGNGRGIMRKFVQLRGNIFAFPIVGGPIMHAVGIHAGGKNIGVAAEAEGGEITAVASAPEADSLRINVGAALQIFSGGKHILIFRRAASRAARGFAKSAAITDPAAIINRQNDVASTGQKLVHRVAVGVEAPVVPAAKHRAYRPAVEK